MFWFSDNGFKKKGKVDRVFIFCFYFQSNMGRVFIFCFYFQQFKNITQASSILLFWQTNNAIVFTLSTGRIVHGTICLERNYTLKLTRTVFSLVAMLNFYFRFRLISHSNVWFVKTRPRHWHAWKLKFGSNFEFFFSSKLRRGDNFFFCTAIKSSHRPKLWEGGVVWEQELLFYLA
jgi:hypothetical protein